MKVKQMVRLGVAVALGAWVFAAPVAQAAFTPVTFSGSSGKLSASATFEIIGQELVVTLQNTSKNDVLVPSDVLTAVFFDIDPALAKGQALTRDSAVVAPGSSVVYGTDKGSLTWNIVGGEWAYAAGLKSAPGNAVLGISSSGLNLFGPKDLFPGGNLSGPASPGGLQYGLTSAGDNLKTGNTGVTKDPLIQSAVVFKLGLPKGYVLESVGHVTFQYGTSTGEPHFAGVAVPEPATMLAGALLLAPLGVSVMRIVRRHRAK